MYMFNGLFINPAYAGSHEVVNLMAIYRHQWVGMDGAPRTANLSVHSPFRKSQYAMGLIVSNDKIGLSNTVTVTPSFSYRIKIKRIEIVFWPPNIFRLLLSQQWSVRVADKYS
jgi:type IX secretion system PorP/SprF family membrane protein